MGRIKGSRNKPKEVVIKDAKECIQEAIEVIQEIIKPKKTIEGWINVYKNKGETCTFFFTGADIHPTKEGANLNAQRNCLGQVFISIEDKP